MDIDALHENRSIGLSIQENCMAWLVDHGPLVASPPLPTSALRSLVNNGRIMRLRRGLYLSPRKSGRLPSLYETINLVDSEGYISGRGALSMHFMTDQDVCRWYSVSSRRQGDIRYGPFEVHFVLSPHRLATAAMTAITGDRDTYQATVATVAQALVDEVSLMPEGLDWYVVVKMLGKALATQRTSASQIASVLSARPSMATARRLGFMIEAITGVRNPVLFAMARENKDSTRIASGETLDRGGPEYIPDWRLFIPCSADFVRMAGRDW